jgi:hypothetical protein
LPVIRERRESPAHGARQGVAGRCQSPRPKRRSRWLLPVSSAAHSISAVDRGLTRPEPFHIFIKRALVKTRSGPAVADCSQGDAFFVPRRMVE